MSLYLTATEIDGLSRASTILLTPFSYESAEAWQYAACAAVQKLLAADASALALSADGRTVFTGEAETVDVLQKLMLPDWAKLSLKPDGYRKHRRVANWTELFDETAVRRSEFYNDLVRPNGLLAPLNMLDDIFVGELPSALTVYYEDEATPAPHVTRRKEILRLLYPSFSAGVRTHCQLTRAKMDALALADAGVEGVLVYDVAGKLLYQNASAARTFAVDPESMKIRLEIQRITTGLGSAARSRNPDARIASNANAEIRTRSGTYKVSAVFFELGFASASEKIIVLLTSAPAYAMDAAVAGKRYGLSERELQVAQLLKRGFGTREVAACLGISINTARRHTENILAKVGAHSRAQAVAILAGQ
ncbi:MAG: response regulator transcription factor [Gemmatimonadaceae bacterium]